MHTHSTLDYQFLLHEETIPVSILENELKFSEDTVLFPKDTKLKTDWVMT